MDYEKIINALKTLKEVCEKSDDCQQCILQDTTNNLRCAVTATSPEFWNIKDIKEFKAFK